MVNGGQLLCLRRHLVHALTDVTISCITPTTRCYRLCDVISNTATVPIVLKRLLHTLTFNLLLNPA